MTPDLHTNSETFVDVGDGHTLYVHDWGNKQNTRPIINIHGGPGGGTSDRAKRWFDPAIQRVIFFDQRGTGRSLPLGELENNTTDLLIEDINTIANQLDIDSFILRGGSWGSCLALAYALKYPQRVAALVLDGIFTASQQEIDWLDQGKFQTFFPDIWNNVLAKTPVDRHNDPIAYHQQRTQSGTELEAKESAYIYASMEASVLSLGEHIHPDSFELFDPTGTKIEMHYLQNGCFMPDRHILDNAHKLALPVYLIQGRYDMVCPPQAAHELSQAILGAELIMTTSGHAAERESITVIRSILRQLTKPYTA